MATLKREDLVNKYQEIKKRIEILENKEYAYKIKRQCDPFGHIGSMCIDDVVKAGASIHDQEKTINECIKLYGVTDEDLKESKGRQFLGYSVDDWDHDFKLRVQEIHDKQELEKCHKASKLLSKNFSDNDKFTIDMSELENLGL